MYSQGQEEAIILKEVARLGIVSGRFLDIGAYDGLKFSNTARLVELRWTGVLVEPSPSVFVKLMSNRREMSVELVQALVVPSAMVDRSGVYSFWDASGDGTSTTEIENKRKWAKAGSKFRAMHTAGITLAQLSAKFPGPFDLISIDTEGTSVLLASEIPESWRPQILIVEHDGKEATLQKAVQTRFSLRQVWCDPNNMIFANP